MLKTVREVIEVLGGLQAVADLCGVNYRTVSGWQARFEAFPPKFYVVMTAALAGRGLSAMPALWGMAGEAPENCAGAEARTS